jgi:hypothetical protein
LPQNHGLLLQICCKYQWPSPEMPVFMRLFGFFGKRLLSRVSGVRIPHGVPDKSNLFFQKGRQAAFVIIHHSLLQFLYNSAKYGFQNRL